MNAAMELLPRLGVSAACEAMGVWRGSPARAQVQAFRRSFVGPHLPARRRRPAPPLALDTEERELLLVTLNSERFVDHAPATVHATLLDEGLYLGSVRTMYRLLAGPGGAVRERRDQLRHPAYAKPELMATRPNEVWSWDITKLKGPNKRTGYHLYVILDIYSRYVTGWMIAECEQDSLARQLISQTIHRYQVPANTLTLHADRGASMRSRLVSDLLVDLQVTRSHSRPHVSDDNPFSESQFKTMKYRPEFPERFGCLEDARTHSRAFFDWYNNHHRHSGIGFMTPHSIHFGHAQGIRQARQATMEAAFHANPLRFRHRSPRIAELPDAVWINPPKGKSPSSITTPETSLNS